MYSIQQDTASIHVASYHGDYSYRLLYPARQSPTNTATHHPRILTYKDCSASGFLSLSASSSARLQLLLSMSSSPHVYGACYDVMICRWGIHTYYMYVCGFVVFCSCLFCSYSNSIHNGKPCSQTQPVHPLKHEWCFPALELTPMLQCCICRVEK